MKNETRSVFGTSVAMLVAASTALERAAIPSTAAVESSAGTTANGIDRVLSALLFAANR